MDLEIKRQVVHAMGVFTVVLILLFGSLYASLIMLSIAIAFVLAGEYRKKKLLSKMLKMEKVKKVETLIDNEVMSYERLNDIPFNGAVMFYLGCFLVTIIFEPWIGIASIVVLSLSDSISTIIGYYLGKHKLFLNKKKTWEGSISFFVVATMILLAFVNPYKALLIGFIVAIVEMMPKINDNISVPLATGILLNLMTNI